MGKKQVLLISAGLVPGAAAEAAADAAASAFPGYEIAQTPLHSVAQALERAIERQVTTLILQPVLLLRGETYRRIADTAAGYAGQFSVLRVGAPLLDTEEDIRTVAGLLADIARPYDGGETAVCFVGHGSTPQGNAVYEQLQGMLAGYCFVGLLRGRPGPEDILAKVRAGPYRRVVLHPLLLAAGGHAVRDIAGEGETAWKTAFARAGYPVECIMRGLGEYGPAASLLAAHGRVFAGTVRAGCSTSTDSPFPEGKNGPDRPPPDRA